MQEGGRAVRGLGAIAEGVGTTFIANAIGKTMKENKKEKGPEFNMNKLNTLGLGSDVNLGHGDPRLSARMLANDPIAKEYGQYLIELRNYENQKKNEKAQEKMGIVGSIAGNLLSFAAAELTEMAKTPVNNFFGRKFGKYKEAYATLEKDFPDAKINYSDVKSAARTGGGIIKIGGAKYKITKDGAYKSLDPWYEGPANALKSLFGFFGFNQGGRIPSMLTAGEGYVPAGVASRIGYGNLDYMNNTGSMPIVQGPGGIDNVGPMGLNPGDFILQKSAADKLLKNNPNMMRFAMQNPDGFRKGVSGYYEGGMVDGDTAAPAASMRTSTDSYGGRIGSLSQSNSETSLQASGGGTSETTNNISINVSIDKSGAAVTTEEGTQDTYQKEKDLSLKIKGAVLDVIREEKRIGGELS